jgi:hypothetical protein
MKKGLLSFSIAVTVISILLIIFLATGVWKRFFYPEEDEEIVTRIVTPRNANFSAVAEQSGQIAWEENLNTRIPLQEGETVIAVLNKESEFGFAEEQFVVYHRAGGTGPVHITFLSYDENSRTYRRIWDLPTAATRPDTISLFSQDLIGDRNNCIILTGMNAQNEHTMTIFRRTPGQPIQTAYRKIAELQIAGSIVILETVRSFAYQQGMARGQAFNIASYGHDPTSDNMLDQIEIIYSFNNISQQYEQIRFSRIPGSQIEQRRLRELLSGVPGVFENFINDLWYYITPQGTIDTRQFLYFDPARREIIFFGDESQQVFRWQTSTPTRYGLFIRSQNMSISTLLRFIDIELEALDRIKLRVNEDVRLRIAANTTWDGSYRRAGAASMPRQASHIRPFADAVYDSSWGRITFSDTGEYTINSGGNIRRGRYVYFKVNGNDLLEMRPEYTEPLVDTRMLYRVENVAGLRIISRVRLGTNGIQDLMEPPITLTPVGE